jgi:hypothetical protein
MTDAATLLAPRSIAAWSVWHPEYEWGLTTPMLYPSKEVAKAKIEAAGLWPLQHGWRLIRVVVAPAAQGYAVAAGKR